MFIILRKSSIKQTLALATLLILIGLSLKSPHFANASESSLFYLYPYPSSNPSQTVLFWSEANPKQGAYTLPMWSKITDKQIVVGLPEGYGINQAMIANNTGNAIVARIKKRIKDGGKGTWKPTDSITYEREITPDSIKEKVKIEIGEHFKDNNNFEKYVEIMKKGLTNKNELPDRPPVPVEKPKDDSTQAIQLFGNTLTLAGIALFALKVLPFVL